MAVFKKELFGEARRPQDIFSYADGLLKRVMRAPLKEADSGWLAWVKRLLGFDKVRRTNFIILLFCAQYADHIPAREENDRINSLKVRLHAGKFKKRDWAAYDRALKRYERSKTTRKKVRIWAKIFEKSLKRFRKSSSPNHRRALLMHALDLIWADKKLNDAEKEFFKVLHKGLGLDTEQDEAFMEDAFEILDLKNNF